MEQPSGSGVVGAGCGCGCGRGRGCGFGRAEVEADDGADGADDDGGVGVVRPLAASGAGEAAWVLAAWVLVASHEADREAAAAAGGLELL